jgi:NAD(P)-dependent dehydrogenase (short-subunit alcohol dehydrogenase family)
MLSAELRGTAIVTGGGRGIGANIARELARAGMDVVVTGRTAEEVRAVTEEIGGRALVGDVSKREDVARWCGDVGAVDLLVSNAGISGPEDPLGDIDAWWHTFEVNVLGTYMCCRAFAPLMIERGGGSIVNVASGSAYCRRGTGRAAPRIRPARRPSIASPRCSLPRWRRRTCSCSRSRPGSSGPR